MSIRRLLTTSALIAAALTTSACADLVTGGPLLRPGEPTGQIVVHNASRNPIHAVLISDCGASTYGLNRLPSGMAIPPGGQYPFTVSAGCWDVDAGALGVGEARQRMQVRAGSGVDYRVN